MGCFSWITQDTAKSIASTDSGRDTFPVTMTDDKGNRWHETDYFGYGEFGGKDFYELLAEMNGKAGRSEGIGIAFGDEKHRQPNLTEDSTWEWRDQHPQSCEAQGYFYDNDNDNDNDDDDEEETT